MEVDQSDEENSRKSDALRNLSAKGPLPISIAKLSGSSRIIPSAKDFHFYDNFQEFKNPIQEMDLKSKNLLEKVGASANLLGNGKSIGFPDDKDVELDDDVALDWLESVNDEIFERFDVSLDEFKGLRRKEEDTGVRMMRVDDEENGFQVVYGKKNKKLLEGLERNVVEVGAKGLQEEVKVAMRVKPKVPFHIPTITKPQDEYKIIVNNVNQPFEHVWLQRSEDGSRFIHPLEKLSVLDFVDNSEGVADLVKPPPLEVTPFKYVEDVKDLKQLAIKLRDVEEFAVDLEHNSYRSFQGMTCLMQISTRTEDFVIDTLKLRIHIGPYLREVFKDPTKRKVMHGADRDIVWLQRDFGIYVCNMFDTGQASRVLKKERFSLEYLLNHYCEVTANKEYQNADWRIRPLPKEMMKYAREDTHYLLYIYDLMRIELLFSAAESESSDPPLVEVYKRSYDICTQLYEKELLTESSYLYIYGVQSAELNAQQLAVVSGLCEWRDVVARAEDESTGYVLPNRTLIDLAKQMPLTTSKLRKVLKSKHPYIERNLGSVVSIIRHSLQNAAAFEETAKYLQERRLEILMQANEENALATEESEMLPSEILETAEEGDNVPPASLQHKDESQEIGSSSARVATPIPEIPKVEVTVQTIKKPTRAFGALFGNSAKRKFDPDKREQEDTKLEQIKSTVSLPFHTFSAEDDQLPSDVEKPAEMLEDVPPPALASGSTLEDIIILDDDESEESEKGEDEPMSLADLSSSFQKCLPSPDQTKSPKAVEKSEGFLQVEPFDYEAAREQVKFGVNQGESGEGGNIRSRNNNNRGDRKKGSAEETADFAQGKRRQAFPASGNRSATFR